MPPGGRGLPSHCADGEPEAQRGRVLPEGDTRKWQPQPGEWGVGREGEEGRRGEGEREILTSCIHFVCFETKQREYGKISPCHQGSLPPRSPLWFIKPQFPHLEKGPIVPALVSCSEGERWGRCLPSVCSSIPQTFVRHRLYAWHRLAVRQVGMSTGQGFAVPGRVRSSRLPLSLQIFRQTPPSPGCTARPSGTRSP